MRIRKKNTAERRANREQLLAYLRAHPCVDCGEADRYKLRLEAPVAKTSAA